MAEKVVIRLQQGRPLIGLLGLLALGATAAHGQTLPNDVSPQAALGEITVTATRRSLSASKVPISVVALSTESLSRTGVKGITEIAALTPGVQFDQNTAFGNTNIAIRGVSSVNGASTTGIYYGDIALQSRVTSLTLVGNPFPVPFDLERVEVLRGPQGTLFGSGAVGGAVRYIPQAPNLTQWDGTASVEYGAADRGSPSYEAQGAVGGPITDDRIGFRVGGYLREDGGSIDRVNYLTGAPVDRDADNVRTVAAKASLAMQLGDAVTVTPEVFYQRRDANDTGVFTFYRSNLDAEQFNNARLLRQSSEDEFTIASVRVEAATPVGDLTAVTGYVDRTAATDSDATNLWGATCFGVSDPINFDCSDPANNLGYGNPLGAAFPNSYADAAPTYSPLEQEVFSQEFRLTSNDPDARLTWVVGAFYSSTEQHDGYLSQSSTAATYLAGYGLGPDEISLDAARRYGLDPDTLVLATEITHEETQYALFGQVEYALTDTLKLALGGRFSWLDLDFRVLAGGAAYFGTATPVTTGSKSENPFTPRIGVSYQPNEQNMFYITAAKGFRTGQGNIPILDSCNFDVPDAASADELWSYEIGSKNRLMQGRLQVDASAFQIDWKDIQTLVTLPCGYTPVLNAASLVSRGFDVATRFQVTDALSVEASVAYTDAKYTSDVVADGNLIVSDGDVVGNLPQVPSPWNVTAAAQYYFPEISAGRPYLRVDAVWRTRNDGPFAAEDPSNVTFNDNARADPSFNVVNLRAGLDGDRVFWALFVNNLFDERPLLGQNYDSGTSNFLVGRTLRPRTFGASVTFRY